MSYVVALIAVCCAAQADKNATSTVPPQFDQVGTFSEGLAVVRLKKKFGYIDTNGQLVIRCSLREPVPGELPSGVIWIRPANGRLSRSLIKLTIFPRVWLQWRLSWTRKANVRNAAT